MIRNFVFIMLMAGQLLNACDDITAKQASIDAAKQDLQQLITKLSKNKNTHTNFTALILKVAKVKIPPYQKLIPIGRYSERDMQTIHFVKNIRKQLIKISEHDDENRLFSVIVSRGNVLRNPLRINKLQAIKLLVGFDDYLESLKQNTPIDAGADDRLKKLWNDSQNQHIPIETEILEARAKNKIESSTSKSPFTDEELQNVESVDMKQIIIPQSVAMNDANTMRYIQDLKNQLQKISIKKPHNRRFTLIRSFGNNLRPSLRITPPQAYLALREFDEYVKSIST